jgi:hypothetical protein
LNKNQGTISNLIRSVSQSDPKLYMALQLLVDDIYAMYGEVFPDIADPSLDGFTRGIPADVTGFILEPFPTNLRASWLPALNAVGYEIRKGTTWETAEFVLTTATTVANLDPIILNLTVGTHTFLIKGINFSGQESVNAQSADLIVPPINGPSLTGTALGNNALLSWVAPVSTWRIRHYNVFQDGVQIAQVDANFFVASVLIAGTYSFQVQAIDIVGNVSALSAAVILELDDPIDLFFLGSKPATLNGTYVRTKRGFHNATEGVFGPLNDTETWEQHFLSRGWNSPQDQIDAGFPIYIQPTVNDGYYEEQFDFTNIYNDVTIVAAYSKFNLIGSTTFGTQISYSTDNVTYTPFEPGPAVLATSVRYVRVRWTFTNLNNLDLGFITALKVSISTQLVLDSGMGHANAADVTGTLINLNKVFLGVNSVTLTADSVQPITLIFDEVTGVSFRAFAFDAAGGRISTDFAWKVRGVV